MTSFVLFDAAGLTQNERSAIRHEGSSIWSYQHLPDDGAADMGPVWMPATEFSLALKASVNAEAKRWWVSSHGEAQGKLTDLARHFQRLCYVRSTDNQRYFFRYADARSFLAMAQALDVSRHSALLGPITKWAFGTRDGSSTVLRGNGLESETGDTSEADRYVWATRLCRMLKSYGIEAYPSQLEAMTCVLASHGMVLDHPGFVEALKQSQSLSSTESIETFFTTWSKEP
jgi:hypothetical protein